MSREKLLKKLNLHPVVRKIWIFTFILMVVIIGIMFLPWQQSIKGEGVLIAYQPEERPYYVYSTISGFIKNYFAKEDQLVKKGQPLVEIVDLDQKYIERLKKMQENTKNQILNTEKSIKILRNKIKNFEEKKEIGLSVYDNKIQQIKNKIKSLKIKKVALENSLKIAKINYERIKNLFKEGIESKRKLEISENKLVKAKAELENINIEIDIQIQKLDMTQKEKEKFLRDIKNKILSTQKDLADAKLKQNKYQKEFEKVSANLSRYKSSVIKAPFDGYVVRILKSKENQYVKKGEPVLLFSPVAKERAILLKIKTVDMPLMKEGLPARIQFEGWPSLQIPGWPEISYGTFGGYISKVDPVSYKEGFYYVFVSEDKKEKWPDPSMLRIGTRANVWIRLSIVPIWYEIWRQVNAFPPKMINPQEKK